MKYIYFLTQTSETICGYLTPAIKIASMVLLAIKILVPIALIVIGLMRFTSAVAAKSDEVDNALKSFIVNVVAAVCVFLVVTIVRLVVNLTTPGAKSACIDCLFDIKTCKNIPLKDPTPSGSSGNPSDGNTEKPPVKQKTPIPSESKWNDNNSMYRIYHITVPENATTNMPLVVYLRGTIDSTKYSNSFIKSEIVNSSFHKQAKDIYGNKLPFILMQPYSNSLSSFSENGDKESVISSLYTQINEVCNEYKCDKDKIIIVGFSLGGRGVWSMVNNYKGFFYKAVSVSGACTDWFKDYGCKDINPSNFKNTPIKAFVGEDEKVNQSRPNDPFASVMENNAKQINSAGGDAQYSVVKNADHRTVESGLYNKALFDWMLK